MKCPLLRLTLAVVLTSTIASAADFRPGSAVGTEPSRSAGDHLATGYVHLTSSLGAWLFDTHSYYKDLELAHDRRGSMPRDARPYIPSIHTLAASEKADLHAQVREHFRDAHWMLRLLRCKQLHIGGPHLDAFPFAELLNNINNQEVLLMLWVRLINRDYIKGPDGKDIDDATWHAMITQFLANPALHHAFITAEGLNLFDALLMAKMCDSRATDVRLERNAHIILNALEDSQRLPSIEQLARINLLGPEYNATARGPVREQKWGVIGHHECSLYLAFIDMLMRNPQLFIERNGTLGQTLLLKTIIDSAGRDSRYISRDQLDALHRQAVSHRRLDENRQEVNSFQKLALLVAAPNFDVAHFLANHATWLSLFTPSDENSLSYQMLCNLPLHDGTPLYRAIINHRSSALTLRLWYRALYEKNLEALDEISSETTYFVPAMQTETIVATTFRELTKDRYDDRYRREVIALLARFRLTTLDDIAALRHEHAALADMMLTAFMPQLQADDFDAAWHAALARAHDGNDAPLQALLASDFNHDQLFNNQTRQQELFDLPIHLAQLTNRDGQPIYQVLLKETRHLLRLKQVIKKALSDQNEEALQWLFNEQCEHLSRSDFDDLIQYALECDTPFELLQNIVSSSSFPHESISSTTLTAIIRSPHKFCQLRLHNDHLLVDVLALRQHALMVHAALNDANPSVLARLLDTGQFAARTPQSLKSLLELINNEDTPPTFVESAMGLVAERFTPAVSDIRTFGTTGGPYTQQMLDIMLTWRDQILIAGGPEEQLMFWEDALAKRTRPDYVHTLLSCEHFNINSPLPGGRPPLLHLFLADGLTQAQATDIAQKLIARGANKYQRDHAGNNIRFYTRQGGRHWTSLERELFAEDELPLNRLKGPEKTIRELRRTLNRFRRGDFSGNTVLLSGEPGTGKTTIARELSKEIFGREPFEIAISGASDGRVGGRAARIADQFSVAKTYAEAHGPCILLFDEIDALAIDTTGLNADLAAERTSAIQTGINSLTGTKVLFIATTNYADRLKEPIRSRMSKVIHFGLPDEKTRAAIIESLTADWPTFSLSPAQRRDLAVSTAGWAPRNIKQCLDAMRTKADDSESDDDSPPRRRRSTRAVHLRHAHASFADQRESLTSVARRRGIHYQPRQLAGEESHEEGFKQLVGYDETVLGYAQYLKEYINNPERFAGLPAPNRLLLYGPAGTGKTTLARALAQEARCSFFKIDAGTLEMKADGTTVIEEYFRIAQTQERAIIFIDEIDAIARETHPCCRTLQTLMEGFDRIDGIAVVGATNFPWKISPPMLDRMKPLHVPLPNHEQRASLFKFYLTKNASRLDESAISEESLCAYADVSEGISPRSIVKVITDARGKVGIRLARGEEYTQLTADDILEAIAEVMKFQEGQNRIYHIHMSNLPPELAFAFSTVAAEPPTTLSSARTAEPVIVRPKSCRCSIM